MISLFHSINEVIDRFYAGNYKRYMILPALLFIIFSILAFVYPGLEKGIDIRGGTLIIVRTDKQVDIATLENALKSFNLTELKVIPFQGGVQIQFGANKALDEAKQLIEQAKAAQSASQKQLLCEQAFGKLNTILTNPITAPNNSDECVEALNEAYSKTKDSFSEKLDNVIVDQLGLTEEQKDRIQHTEVSPTLGRLFWEHALKVFIIAAIAIIIVVFAFFREVVPSLAIIAAATFDILTALAFMAIFRIPFSLATVSALLMLVGYSVDTDIMLTTRLFKRAGTLSESAGASLKTGLTMTGTTLVAVMIMTFFSVIWAIDIVFSIASVMLFGLLGDLISTWFMNAPLLLWYVERKGRKHVK